MFTIILRLSSILGAAASQVGNVTRILIAAGLGRARISVLWAAFGATLAKQVNSVARTRIGEQITNNGNLNKIFSNQYYDEYYETRVIFNYQNIAFETVTRSTSNLSDSGALQAAINRVMASPYGSQMISTVRQEKLSIMQNLCSGLPVAVVAFFLGTSPAGAEECIPDTDFFDERVYGLAETNARAKFSSSGLWVLQPLQVNFQINIGEPMENMDPQIYNELVAWKNGLNVNQVLDEIQNQGSNNDIEYWSEITSQANEWVNGLNSGQVQPSGGISIQGSAFFSGNVTLNPGLISKYLSANLGHIDKQTNVPVSSAFPCDPYEYSCSPADIELKSPFYNCKGWIVINNGESDAFGFSMGNADTTSSAPTLSSLLVPVVVNGKLIQGSSLAQAYGHFYTNEEQIAGTKPFWINQAGSIQEHFFLCAA